MWRYLRNRQVDGLKFRRQHSIESFIMDFYCPEIKLCIELDGGVHDDSINSKKDAYRTHVLNENGITVLRYDNEVVLNNPGAIIESIINFAKKPSLRRGYIKNEYIE